MDLSNLVPISHYSSFVRGEDVFLGMLVYIDDIILMRNDPDACLVFKSYLPKCFNIKDLGVL